MPELNLTMIVIALTIVLLLLALPFVVVRLSRSRKATLPQDIQRMGPGPGFTYALVPPGGHPDGVTANEKGSWQWCLAFIPDETVDGGSEMPPWWAPAPPWSAVQDLNGDFSRDADALQAVFEQTSDYPAAR